MSFFSSNRSFRMFRMFRMFRSLCSLRGSSAPVLALTVWLGVIAVGATPGCASNSAGRSRDPLSDEDFSRTAQSPPPSRRGGNGDAPSPDTRRLSEDEYAPRPAPVDSAPPLPSSSAPVPKNLNEMYTHRRNMCVDGKRYIHNGDQYRQGCMICTCEADNVRERINCMETTSCHAPKKPEIKKQDIK